MKRARVEPNDSLSYTLPQLHIDGYEVLDKPINVTEQLLTDIKKIGDKGLTIFNHNKNKRTDGKRVQAHITTPKGSVLNFKNQVYKLLQTEYPNLRPNGMVVIKSKAGCQDQAQHCDYEQDLDFSRCPDDSIPLGCIIAVMPNTKLHVWPKSIKCPHLAPDLLNKMKPIERQTISLDVGDVLIFRGDLVHAGCSYEEDHYRVHTYVDSHLVPRKNNRTWLMLKAPYITE